MKRLALVTGVIALMSLPSCKQPKYQKNKAASSKAALSFLETNIDVDFQEQTLRAQLDDIPTFVGSSFIFIDDKAPENNVCFAVSCKADAALIKDFYLSEMGNLGWQKIGQLDASDITFLFQKPQKICIIALQPSSQEVTIQIKSMARIAE